MTADPAGGRLDAFDITVSTVENPAALAAAAVKLRDIRNLAERYAGEEFANRVIAIIDGEA